MGAIALVIWTVASILLVVLIGSIADLDQVSSVLGLGLMINAAGVVARRYRQARGPPVMSTSTSG